MGIVNTCEPTKTRRTRTPSDLKYLLNERAAVAGALTQVQMRAAPLLAELACLEAQAEHLRLKLEPLQAQESEQRVSLDALDTVIQHMYPTADPSCAGTVKASSGRCGHRGELAKFLLSALRQAPAEGVAVSTLLLLVASKFGLTFGSPQERENFRDGVRRQLRRWRDAGLARSSLSGSNRPTRWHAAGPAVIDLLAVAGERDAAYTDAGGGEVDGQ